MKRFPNFKQFDAKDCGPVCLQIIAIHYGKYFSLQELRERVDVTKEGASIYDLAVAGEELGLKSLAFRTSYKRLYSQVKLPCIVLWEGYHFIVVYKVTLKKVYVSDPALGLISYSKKDFAKGWLGYIKEKDAWRKGVVIAFEPNSKFKEIEGGRATFMQAGRNLVVYLSPYKIQVFQLMFVMFIVTLIQALIPIITQSIIDIGISSSDISFIKLLLIGNIFLVVSTSLGTWIRSSLNLHISSRLKISMLSDYIIKLFKLPLNFFENKLIGDIIQRSRDYERIESFILNSAFNVFLAILNTIVFSIILLIYNPILFWIFITGSVLYVAWVLMFWAIRKRMDIRYFSLMGENQSHWIEMLTNIMDIKNNNYGIGKRWKWEKVQVGLYRVGLKLLHVGQVQEIGSRLISNLKDIALIFFSATAVIDGKMTLGMMLAIQYIIGQLNSPLKVIIDFIMSSQMAYISYMRINEINGLNDEEPEEIANSNFMPIEKSIILQNVYYRYQKNERNVISNLSFEIPEGKTTAIVGASGSGKSTLLKILFRVYKPVSGQVLVGDCNSLSISLRKWRQECGIVSQESTFFKDTILNNITLGSEKIDIDKLYRVVAITNIKDEIEGLPLGYKTMIGENGKGLSEGQKQRILLARALYKSPNYLFFDEATNSLDSENEESFINSLKEHYKSTTIVIAAHRLSTIRNADRVVVLEKGMIVDVGNHLGLLKKKGVYYKLFKNQLTHEEEELLRNTKSFPDLIVKKPEDNG